MHQRPVVVGRDADDDDGDVDDDAVGVVVDVDVDGVVTCDCRFYFFNLGFQNPQWFDLCPSGLSGLNTSGLFVRLESIHL